MGVWNFWFVVFSSDVAQSFFFIFTDKMIGARSNTGTPGYRLQRELAQMMSDGWRSAG